jgi:hypothetical protein
MKRLVCFALLVSFTLPNVAFALDGKKAAYFGGTASAFAGAKDPVEGRLDTANEEAFILTLENQPYAGQTLRIPYARIEDLEYGQKAGRRVGAAVATAVLLGPIGLVTLFSKKRKHFLTIGYKDAEGKDQVAVLELGKDLVRTTLPIIETRSGKQIQYQDDEARKASKG